jgi:hypothetical protein
MRPMFRTTFVALLAVFALSAVGSASAEARECRHVANETTFCVQAGENPNKEITGEVGFKSTSSKASSSMSASDWGGLGEADCSTVGDTGTIHANNTEGVPLNHRIIELSNCRVEGHEFSKCEIAEPEILGKEGGATGLEGEVTLGGSEFQLGSYTSIGTELGVVNFKSRPSNTCYLGGTWRIEQSSSKVGLACHLPDIKTAAVEHTVECSGEKVTIGGGSASIHIKDEIALTGTYAGYKWSLWEK